MEELTSAVRANNDNARPTSGAVGLGGGAGAGGGVAGGRYHGRDQRTSRKIVDIIAVIDGIARPTSWR
jgi:methyl-accepting chemotaxis protein